MSAEAGAADAGREAGAAESAGAPAGRRARARAAARRAAAPRALAIAANAALAVAILLAPWYALATYVANGWDATWWARAALVVAAANVVALRGGADRLLPAAGAALALALVALRVALPPDFGLDFDGLHVPVERRWGAWLALGLAAAALAATLRIPPPPRRARPPGW